MGAGGQGSGHGSVCMTHRAASERSHSPLLPSVRFPTAPHHLWGGRTPTSPRGWLWLDRPPVLGAPGPVAHVSGLGEMTEPLCPLSLPWAACCTVPLQDARGSPNTDATGAGEDGRGPWLSNNHLWQLYCDSALLTHREAWWGLGAGAQDQPAWMGSGSGEQQGLRNRGGASLGRSVA